MKLNKYEQKLKDDFQRLADNFFDKHKYFPPIQSVGYNIEMEHYKNTLVSVLDDSDISKMDNRI